MSTFVFFYLYGIISIKIKDDKKLIGDKLYYEKENTE